MDNENKEKKNWKGIFTVFQILLDVIVGMAVHYVLNTFFTWNPNTVLVVTLIATAFFAEIWEVKVKK